MTKTPESSQKAGNTSLTSLPMFYSSPRPLDRSRDGKIKMARIADFSFARKTNAIPLLIEEFSTAAAHYPIVFADGELPVPAAVVGLQNDSNLFINADGSWLQGAYLPAYVRRYPFILMDDPSNKQFVLCIDDTCPQLREDGEFPLFDGDQPSAFTKSAMEFCGALRRQGDATDDFVKAMKENNLLVANNTEIIAPDGTRFRLSGFLVIDPKKFEALPDNIILNWRKKGWLPLIYAQLLSSARWQSLVSLIQTTAAK
ncbi:MAG: SapC family protein [Alphaproteobacteria bacterium]|nr:SapC family protein [Alphaproteobacteria bacterium]